MDWTPPPEPMAWVLPKPIVYGQASFTSITVRAPTAGDVLKASSIPNQSNGAFILRLIADLSLEGVPYEALAQPGENGVPQYIIEQISAYVDLFGGAPIPGPLAEWQAEMRARVAASASGQNAAAPQS